jgi:hypothetical protein
LCRFDIIVEEESRMVNAGRLLHEQTGGREDMRTASTGRLTLRLSRGKAKQERGGATADHDPSDAQRVSCDEREPRAPAHTTRAQLVLQIVDTPLQL